MIRLVTVVTLLFIVYIQLLAIDVAQGNLFLNSIFKSFGFIFFLINIFLLLKLRLTGSMRFRLGLHRAKRSKANGTSQKS